MTLNIPRLERLTSIVEVALGLPTYTFQVWWDKVAGTLETNFNDLASVVQQLVDLNSDDLLTPAKKPMWIFMYSVLTSEQSSLDTQATTYGITTEKTNYDTAISDLTSHLATLTTPVAWNDLSGNTTIVGTTFRSKFNDVTTKKTILQNKMADKAKTLADAAQTQANTATTNAANAQSTADTVKRDSGIAMGWTSPGTLLTGHDAGTDVTISIAAHTRYYSDVSSVSVNSGTLTGAAYNTVYYIYYDQTSRAGGAVTYQKTTNANTGMSNKVAGRHFCGKITTPAAAAADTTGAVNPPSGGGGVGGGEVP